MEEESPKKVCGLYSGPEPGFQQGVTELRWGFRKGSES